MGHSKNPYITYRCWAFAYTINSIYQNTGEPFGNLRYTLKPERFIFQKIRLIFLNSNDLRNGTIFKNIHSFCKNHPEKQNERVPIQPTELIFFYQFHVKLGHLGKFLLRRSLQFINFYLK